MSVAGVRHTTRPPDVLGGIKQNRAELVTESDGQTRYSRLYWDSDALVCFTRIAAPAGESTNDVHYRLSFDGKTLEAHEERRGVDTYDNLWMFQRESSGVGRGQLVAPATHDPQRLEGGVAAVTDRAITRPGPACPAARDQRRANRGGSK